MVKIADTSVAMDAQVKHVRRPSIGSQGSRNTLPDERSLKKPLLAGVGGFLLVMAAFATQAHFILPTVTPQMSIIPMILGVVTGTLLGLVVYLNGVLKFRNQIHQSLTSITREFNYVTDKKGVFHYVSPVCEQITGYSAEEFYSTPVLMLRLLHPDDRERWSAHRHGVPFGEAVEKLEVRIINKSGQSVWLSHTCSRMPHEKDKICSSNVDITENKRVEKKLLEAVTEAEIANDAKTNFLANMSHELRTPLNAIIGFSQILKMETFGPLGSSQNQEYVKIIGNSGAHLNKIIGDILDLSKIESETVNLVEEEIDAADVISECLEMLSERAAKKQLTTGADIQADIPPFQADRVKVRQILLNLLSNAIKFTPQDGEVKVLANLTEQRSILFRVQDTGIGINPEDMDKVLEPFAQTGNAFTKGHEGAGLGLSICKRLMEIHGGALEVESKFGKGTVVSVCFPPERTLAP